MPSSPREFLVPSSQWDVGGLQPYGPLSLSPAAGVLNYGQGLFEGMKAYRTVAGRVVLFRPDQARMSAFCLVCVRAKRCPERGTYR